MLGGVAEEGVDDGHHTRQLSRSIQGFADSSLKLCKEEKFEKLKQFLKVALKLFKEGNATVRNAIVNVYLYTLSRHWTSRSVAGNGLNHSCLRNFGLNTEKMHYDSSM